MDLWFREPLFCSGCRNNDFSCQTVGETTVGRFAVIVQIPKSYRLTTSPARFSRAVRYAPLRNAIPLCCWNDFEILIDDELVELCHLQLLVEGYIFSLDAFWSKVTFSVLMPSPKAFSTMPISNSEILMSLPVAAISSNILTIASSCAF